MTEQEAWEIFEKNNPWFILAEGDRANKYYKFVKISADPLTSYVFDLEESTAGFRGTGCWFIPKEDSSYNKYSDKALEDYFADYRKPNKIAV